MNKRDFSDLQIKAGDFLNILYDDTWMGIRIQEIKEDGDDTAISAQGYGTVFWISRIERIR